MSASPGSSQSSWTAWSPGSNSSSLLTVDLTRSQLMEIGISPPPPQAYLVLKAPPENRFRYRYDTEMSGTHGSLQAERGGREKSIPTVELVGYTDPVIVRVSLFTCNKEGQRYPHPHRLFVKEKLYLRRYINIDGKHLYKTGHYIDPHYIIMNDNIAKFEGMCIISSKKEHFPSVIKEKLLQRGERDGPELEEMVTSSMRYVDNAFVCLCFEAFKYDNRILGEMVCPPIYSKPIANAKNASTGKLKITRINKCSGSCRGGDSIWLLVEKINKKNLVVRFFETSVDGTVVWEAVVGGDKLELHHQYAVIFNTPPYKDQDITRDVTVSMRLERCSESLDYSDSESFVYEPIKQSAARNDNIYRKESMFSPSVPNKRPISDLFSPCSVPNKRRTEELFPTDMFPPIEESQVNTLNAIFQELQDLFVAPNYDMYGIPSKEGYQQYIPGTFVGKDGVEDPTNRALALLRLLLQAVIARAQMKDKDLRSVTEQIGRLFLRHDDLRLQDAASTLLSMRSRGAPKGKRSVHEAIATGESEAVATALNSGADPGEVDKAGRTPLHVSVEAGLLPCVQLLLRHESKQEWINLRNKQGLTALHLAISKRDLLALQELLSAGANVNLTEPSSDRTPLIMAVKIGDPGLVQCILAHSDIDLNHRDKEGHTAIDAARDNSRLSSLFIKNEPSQGVLDKVADVLNETGGWKHLAQIWDITEVIPSAERAENPAKHIIGYVEQKRGIDLEALRNLLDAIEERSAVAIIDEALTRKFL